MIKSLIISLILTSGVFALDNDSVDDSFGQLIPSPVTPAGIEGGVAHPLSNVDLSPEYLNRILRQHVDRTTHISFQASHHYINSRSLEDPNLFKEIIRDIQSELKSARLWDAKEICDDLEKIQTTKYDFEKALKDYMILEGAVFVNSHPFSRYMRCDHIFPFSVYGAYNRSSSYFGSWKWLASVLYEPEVSTSYEVRLREMFINDVFFEAHSIYLNKKELV